MAQKTVLLAEDDLEIRDILQDLLEAEGYDVVPASHGRQALEFLQGARGEKLPDLVVLDLMMAARRRPSGARHDEERSLLAPIPVVVLSAVARERPVGAAAFLRKPIRCRSSSTRSRDSSTRACRGPRSRNRATTQPRDRRPRGQRGNAGPP